MKKLIANNKNVYNENISDSRKKIDDFFPKINLKHASWILKIRKKEIANGQELKQVLQTEY